MNPQGQGGKKHGQNPVVFLIARILTTASRSAYIGEVHRSAGGVD